MYEVNSYSPQAWTPPRKPVVSAPKYSPRTPSPTKSPSPKRALLDADHYSFDSKSSSPSRIPAIPASANRYRQRSPDRYRRSDPRSTEFKAWKEDRDRAKAQQPPSMEQAGPDSYHLQPSMHRYQSSRSSAYSEEPEYEAPSVPAHHGQRYNAVPIQENPFERTSAYDGAFPSASPRHSQRQSYFEDINPHNIADDRPSTGRDRGHEHYGAAAGFAMGAGAAGGAAGALRGFGGRARSGNYSSAPQDPHAFDGQEKASWRDMDARDQKKRKRTILIIVGVIAVLVIIGAVVGGVVGSRKAAADKSSSNGTTGTSTSGSDLDINSSQVKALMNNPNLHRVFPAMDYTGVNMQYPDCLKNPPIQDNVTMDVAMMSQLTNAVRVYGTDCGQAEMVLEAFSRLHMNDTMQLWLGVWLDNDQPTNQRQLNQMYDTLKKWPTTFFKGIIVGNEVLFRKDLGLEQLGTTIQGVRQNLTNMKIDLTVSTSDLGSDWTEQLVTYSDIIMANVHPFFAGVDVAVSASWTWSFWQNNDVALTANDTAISTVDNDTGNKTKNIISEVGWPTQGGNDCGTGVDCSTTTGGSVAGIDEMNSFMEQWVCQALANGTEYFWFEAFDEPWKIMYDTGSDGWEDHWGLMTVDRQLKPNVKIPDCGGKTVA